MPLSLEGHPNEAQALEVLNTFVNGGGNFIDTANVYCVDDSDVGHNEQLIAKALKQYKNANDILLALKAD